MHRQIRLLAEDGMSPALTKNEYGVMIGEKKKKKEKKPSQGQNWKRECEKEKKMH